MKLADLPVLGACGGMVLFFLFPETRELYERAYMAHPLVITFLKFAFLATAGELMSLRIASGSYYRRDFGVVPKMIIWGILGLAIYCAFVIFSHGTAALFPGLSGSSQLMSRVLTAFLTSLFMNTIFAPVMMMVHHLTDAHIAAGKGRFLFQGFSALSLFSGIRWERLWGFVYKKTIPLFWIPAHTITFLLPGGYRTLFAALLSVALGIFLGLAASGRAKGSSGEPV